MPLSETYKANRAGLVAGMLAFIWSAVGFLMVYEHFGNNDAWTIATFVAVGFVAQPRIRISIIGWWSEPSRVESRGFAYVYLFVHVLIVGAFLSALGWLLSR